MAGLVLLTCSADGALRYTTNQELQEQLKTLSVSKPELVRMESIARSWQSNEVWLVEIGKGEQANRRTRPALLLVAGIEGNDLAGSASAVAWLESLIGSYAKEEKIRSLLDTATIYVVPRLNPDAAEQFFAKPKQEATLNRKPVDEDRDGLVDEDGAEDLDGDGLIMAMRVEDADGEYILDPAEPRLLMKADRKKGEQGAWRLLIEGVDNDKDEAWNEDGPGGVNLNRNFSYNYKYFAPWAGLHQVSEVETRALADFVVSHPNIGIVFTFGGADNLVQAPKGEAPKRPPVAIHEEDAGLFRDLGKAWREALGLKKELTPSSEPGSFSDWVYFHRGRLSLAAKPWSPALQVELAKPKKEETDKPKEEKKAEGEEKKPAADEKKPEKGEKTDAAKSSPEKKPESRNEEERGFLKWVDENAPELFMPWKAYQHPDFPGKRVEIGGFVPFAKTNPPEKLLEDLAGKQGKFLTDLAGKLPRIGIRKVTTKHLGNGVYELILQIENTGYLPTALAQGSLSREVFPTRVVLKVDAKLILSGATPTTLGPIEGQGGRKEVRYIIQSPKDRKVEVEVISMLGGTVQKSVELQEEK